MEVCRSGALQILLLRCVFRGGTRIKDFLTVVQVHFYWDRDFSGATEITNLKFCTKK